MPTILIIDDDESFRRVITKYIAKSGFEVVAAANGPEGVASALEQPVDLVVCDLGMPGMDGFEVLRRLRQQERFASVPVIFLTGQSEPRQVRQGMNLGADDYLTKPVDLGELVKAIQARLARRQAETEKQERQLARAMQLFSGIIHDLRDPLFVVLGQAEQLKHTEDSAGPDAGAQVLDRMHQGLERMQSILAQTMLLVRSRMQRLPFAPGPLDLREFCEQLVAAHEQRGRLRFECAPGEYRLVADSFRLRQALENLLSNALKYSQEAVTVELQRQADSFRLEVRDRGIGIPAEQQPSLFEPFFRATNALPKPGHGLGLTIAKSSIEQHGGRLSFVSEANQGTTFSIVLPAAPPAAAAAAAPPGVGGEEKRSGRAAREPSVAAPEAEPRAAAGTAAAGRLKALLVDDDALVRAVLRDFLEKAGEVEVVGEAGTLEQARFLARHQAPEVVFLDVGLPDGSGFGLLPDLPAPTAVVLVTSAEEYAVHAFDCAATDYLLKPVSFERLQRALGRVRQHFLARGNPGSAADSKLEATFLVRTPTEKRAVKIGAINRIIAYDDYSWVYWDKDKRALLRKSLKQWLRELPAEQFVRVHRRAIVNLACMERVEKLPGGRVQVYLRDVAEPILVSLRLSPVLNRRLKHLGRKR